MTEWATVGEVVKMQIARQRIRNGPVYNPSPLLEVDSARLTADGVVGFDGQSWVLDSHHKAHPERTHWAQHRVLLIGFESNYRTLWEEFRPIFLGAAGENVIVSSDSLITPEAASGGIRITSGENELILDKVDPAIGCFPFTRYILEQPEAAEEKIADSKERLSQGLRGFVVPYINPDPFDLQLGTAVAVRSG